MTSEADLILIEQYLRNDLDPDQLHQLEQRISEDEDFALSVQLMKEMPQAILVNTDLFRREMKTIIADEKTAADSTVVTKQAKQVSLRKLLLTAAAILIGITLAINILVPTKETDLYSMNFSIPAENITTRNDQEINPIFQTALQAYSNGDYETATTMFQQYLSDYPEEVSCRFFLAISQMAVNRFADAEINLADLEKNPGPYQQAATWYLGLLYLKTEQKGRAKMMLSRLLEPENSYTQKAQTIINRLPQPQ